ncbi:hypothetical protein [Pseudomonas sp. ZL2]
MPTENRSSNTEQMVSVPMSTLEKCLRDANLVRFTCDKHVLLLQDLLSQPAAQHQGELVAWRYREHGGGKWSVTQEPPGSWYMGAADYEIEPLHTHADAGEVERWKSNHKAAIAEAEGWREEADTLRAQLGEALTLAEKVRDANLGMQRQRLSDLLTYLFRTSAGAEPAPTSDGFSAGDMADQGAKAFAARDPEAQELRAKLAERENQCANLRATINAVRTVFEDNVDVVEYIDALTTGSAEPSAPVERDQGIPGTSFQRLNMLANQGE